MSRLTRGGTAEPVSRDQILRRERGQGNIYFPSSADREQDWQPYLVDPYSCYMCDHTYTGLTRPLCERSSIRRKLASHVGDNVLLSPGGAVELGLGSG